MRGFFFLFVDDMAAAVSLCFENKLPEFYIMWDWRRFDNTKTSQKQFKDHKTIPESMWDATKPDGTQENNGCF
jgi:hypothetical protein